MLSIPAVSSVGFIAGTVASLPIRLYRTENGKSMEVTDDYRLRLLNEETGDLLDAFQWKCTLVRDHLLPGNGYTYVDWAENRIQGLYCVDPLQVSAEIGSDSIYKTARFTIRPVLAALQPAINCFYLLKKEKGVLSFDIDLDALNATDRLSRYRPTRSRSKTAGCSWMKSAMRRAVTRWPEIHPPGPGYGHL